MTDMHVTIVVDREKVKDAMRSENFIDNVVEILAHVRSRDTNSVLGKTLIKRLLASGGVVIDRRNGE